MSGNSADLAGNQGHTCLLTFLKILVSLRYKKEG
jgi:hypothetical protein